jgi:hypothetical protein
MFVSRVTLHVSVTKSLPSSGANVLLHCYLFALFLFLGITLPGHVALSLFIVLCVLSRCSRSGRAHTLETAPHVLGGTTTHHQEHKQLYLRHLVFVTPLLLSAAIVEELELLHLKSVRLTLQACMYV